MPLAPDLLDALRRAVGPQAVVSAPDALRTYDADASMIVARAPEVVVLPADTGQAAEVVRLALRHGLPVVARGAGTGIAGGAIALRGGVLLSAARMDRVESIDPRSRRAVVQAGVVNAELNARLAPLGYQFAPDPSSQRASTIGGNLATNAGGPHCLKYGVTANHILAVELIGPDGEPRWTGAGVPDEAGYDLTGLVVGSEGTFGVVTRAIVRLTPLPEANRVVLALFPSVVAASSAVSRVIAAGSMPTSLEVMDHNAIRAVNSAYGLGLPEAAGTTLLIVEVDGVEDGLDDLLEEVLGTCRAEGAFELRAARTPAEQARVWAARKSVAGAIGRLAPAYLLVDTVVPRTRLPLMMEHVERLRREHAMEVCNVFHAGDGNLHPLVLYDPRDPDQARRAHAIAEGVLALSIAQGGVISGEHGIGLEKQDFLPLLFQPHELQLQAAIYTVFNPRDQFNPAKIFPGGASPADLAEARRRRIDEARQTPVGTERAPSPAAGGVSAAAGGVSAAAAGASPAAAGASPAAAGVSAAAAGASPAGPAALTSLAAIVGPDHVRPCPPFACALFPGSVAELSAAVALCHREGLAVVPTGGPPVGAQPPVRAQPVGTQRAASLPEDAPLPPRVLISTARLADVIVYEPDDLTIRVGAGMTLARLQAVLAEHGQILPLDVADPAAATIGGLVAAGAEGPRRLGYGTLRDLVLSLTMIEADGTPSRLGAQVVKNVTGYDLVKLLVGSRGTLGLIADVALKVFPRPRAAATFRAACPDRAAAVRLIDAIAGSKLQPTAVEYVEGVGGSLGLTGPALIIRAEGHPAAVARHGRELAELAARCGARGCAPLAEAGAEGVWRELAAFAAPPAAEGEALLRVCAPPAELGALLDHGQGASPAARGVGWACVARALSGVAYLRLRGADADLLALHAELLGRWRHVHLLAGPPALRERAPAWGAEPAGIALMRALKRALDPYDTLNPGGYIV